MWQLITGLASNLGYTILVAYTISKSKILHRVMAEKQRSKKDIFILGIVFGIYGIMGTSLGINYRDSIVNIRNIALILASITCGPWVGGIAGVIAGAHRFFYGLGRSTAVACSIGTLIAGIFPGMLFKKSDLKKQYIYGVFSVIITESISMMLICIIADNGISIVDDIFLPMLCMNCVGILIVITIVNNIYNEKERVEGEQARITLEIANRTLPYFKEVNETSLKMVCEIIRDSLGSEFVLLTDDKEILAYSARNKNIKILHKMIVNDYTKQVIKTGKPMILSDEDVNTGFELMEKKIKSSIITPLKYDDNVIGVLKISFNDGSYITKPNLSLAEGLSNLISTQLQLGKIKKLQEMANKAEIRALQTQINPHFLFNALHTITSFVRIDPEMARELIVNLSDYLRFNLEVKDNLIELGKEIEQVKAYVAIEKARFGEECIQMHYEIDDEDLLIEIPPLTIEPLVENAIKHGILEKRTGKNIWVKCKKNGPASRIIIIEDDGCGIEEKIIHDVYEENMSNNKIGLFNVYSRLKLIYGKPPLIERLQHGTRITFEIGGRENNECYNS